MLWNYVYISFVFYQIILKIIIGRLLSVCEEDFFPQIFQEIIFINIFFKVTIGST